MRAFTTVKAKSNGAKAPESGPTMALSPRRYYNEHLFIAATIADEQKLIDKDRAPGGNPWHAYNRGKGVSRLRSQLWAQEANRHECRVVIDGQPVCSCGLIATKPLLEDDGFDVGLYLYEPGHIDINHNLVTFFVVRAHFETYGGEEWLFCQFCDLLEKVVDGTDDEIALQFETVKAAHQVCSTNEYFQRLALDDSKLQSLYKQAALALKRETDKHTRRAAKRGGSQNE